MDETHPELGIQIIGINERGHEGGNGGITSGRSLPWLQDLDSDGDGSSDVWLGSWDYAYRDVVIVDANNVPVEAYNLTRNDLSDGDNANEFKDKLITVAQQTATLSWTNPVNPLDVNDDSFVTPFDAILVINELNAGGPGEFEPRGPDDPYYLDPSGDGFLAPWDALMIINRLTELNSVAVAAVPAPSITTPSNVLASGSNARDTSADLWAAAIDATLAQDEQTGTKEATLDESTIGV